MKLRRIASTVLVLMSRMKRYRNHLQSVSRQNILTPNLDSPKLHRFQGLVGLTKTRVEKKRQRTHLSRMITPYPSKDNCSTGTARSTARKRRTRE